MTLVKTMKQNINKTPNQAKLVSAEKLANLFYPKVHVRTIRRWQKERVIPFTKVGGSIYFNPEKVLRHVEDKYTIEAI